MLEAQGRHLPIRHWPSGATNLIELEVHQLEVLVRVRVRGRGRVGVRARVRVRVGVRVRVREEGGARLHVGVEDHDDVVVARHLLGEDVELEAVVDVARLG